MSLMVNPNPDGSYTVECNGVKMVIGGGGSAPSPTIIWPKVSDNDDGVGICLHVGPRPSLRPSSRRSRFAAPVPVELPRFIRPPSLIEEVVPGASFRRRSTQGDRVLVLELEVPAGQPIDVARLKEVVRPARGEGREVQLHIYVEMSTPAPDAAVQLSAS